MMGRNFLNGFYIVVILTLGMTYLVMPQTAFGKASHSYVPGEVLVRFKKTVNEVERSNSRNKRNTHLKKKVSRNNIELLQLGKGQNVNQIIDELMNDPNVEYAEPNWRVEPLGEIIPNDPLFVEQWYLKSAFGDTIYLFDIPVPQPDGTIVNERFVIEPGDSLSIGVNTYTIDSDIDAPEAWAVLNSAYSNTFTATVGVIDSGLSESGVFNSTTGYIPNHEDLSGSIVSVNSGEEGGSASTDDDLNGFVDDVSGWDWYTSDDAVELMLPGNEPDDETLGEDPIPADSYTATALSTGDPTDHWHGTSVSGLFAADWNNSTGIAGLAQDRVKVLPLRVYIGGDGLADILDAIDYAAVLASNGADIKVLNASWRLAGSSPSFFLKDRIEFAASKGIIFVAAAGNSFSNNDISPVYPASHSIDSELEGSVLSVGSSSYDGKKSSFSNYGENSVQIAAPGTYILTTSKGNSGYSYVSGTSFSTPITAGLAAILAGAHPAMSATESIERIVDGGVFDDRLAGVFQGGKRLNMAGALAPFHPYSNLSYMDTSIAVNMYSDGISASYGSIFTATSEEPSVAVMKKDVLGAWAVSPLAPGITHFNLTFTGSPSTGSPSPVAQYRTGPWRVTAIKPFKFQNLWGGEQIDFNTTGNLPGLVSWQVEDTRVGAIDSNGIFTAKGLGTTRVVLLVDDIPYDTSAAIHVVTSAPSSGGGSGCGLTASPGDPYFPGLLEMLLLGTILMLIRRRHRLALGSPTPNVQCPTKPV